MMNMRLFGDFALYSETAQVDEKTLHSNKLVRLLVYILLHRDRNLTHQELIDTFWEEDGSRNPEGALKNLIYRLRNELKVFGKEELILTCPGAYCWNPDVSVEADYDRMEQAARQAKTAGDTEEKKRILEKGISIYRNEVSARISTQSWIFSRLTYYRVLYTDMVKLLAEIYVEENEWKKAEILCQTALHIDSLDEELHYWLIRTYIGRGNYEAAIEGYEKAKRLFYDQFGVRQMDLLEGLYEEILSVSGQKRVDIGGLMQSVSEQEDPRGVFVCEYPVFREIYRVEARRIRRTGIAEYVLLITMKKSGRIVTEMSDDSIRIGMEELLDLLNDMLRTGDVVARYSSSQYVVLLPGCTYESTSMISGRIESKFRSRMGKKRLTLQFEVEEVQAAAD